MEEYLKSTPFLEVDHSKTNDFCQEIASLCLDPKEKAIALYYKVRDTYLYDPFHLDLRKEALKSSLIMEKKRAWCTEKVIILATCARHLSIPSRLGFAIVINHIGTDKLKRFLKREEIVFHGYVELFIEGKWIKCTPAFDKNLCRISKVAPLEWDGQTDSLFQQYNNGRKYMEYLKDYGTFSDLPIELMSREMQKYYPHLFKNIINTKEFALIPEDAYLEK